jgi:hypothetical protein
VVNCLHECIKSLAVNHASAFRKRADVKKHAPLFSALFPGSPGPEADSLLLPLHRSGGVAPSASASQHRSSVVSSRQPSHPRHRQEELMLQKQMLSSRQHYACSITGEQTLDEQRRAIDTGFSVHQACSMIARPQMREALGGAVGSATTASAGQGSMCSGRRKVECLTAAALEFSVVRGGHSRQRQQK